jgi:O-antigen/teichoic acid export membrane protein
MNARDKPTGLTHRAVSGMVWIAWGSGAVAVLRVVVLVLLTRLLSPSDFGVVSAGLIVISFSLTFSLLGVGPALVQRPVLEERHISTAFFASLGFGLATGVLVWLLAPLIARFFRIDELVPIVRALSLVFPITGALTVSENLLQRDLRFRLLSNTELLSYGVGYGIVGVVLAVVGWGAWALVVANLVQVLLKAVLVTRAAPPVLHPRPSWVAFRELMDYGVGQSAARIAWIFANQADNLIVGRWLGAVALGLYSRAYQLMAVPSGLPGTVLDKVLFPAMARVQNDPRRLASAYLQGTAFIALVTLPVGVVAAVLAPELVATVFGHRWEAIVPPFQVLALGMMFRTSFRMSDSLSRATGTVYRRAWRQVLYAGLVFLGAWVGHYQGLTGVAVGVLVALFANYIAMAQLSLNVVQISWLQFARAQLPALRLTIVIGVVTVAAAAGLRHFGMPPLVGLLIGSAAAGGAAALTIWLAPMFALGDHGIRMGNLLRVYLQARLPRLRIRRSA